MARGTKTTTAAEAAEEGPGPLPERKAARHSGWRVQAQVLFEGRDGQPRLVDEMPREAPRVKAGDKRGPRLGRRKLKRGPLGADGKPTMVAVTPAEQPVIIPLDVIPEDQAIEFQEAGALVPHYA